MSLASDIKRYGITVRDYDYRLAIQNHTCAICFAPHRPDLHRGRLVVDHDHKGGRVRGLLCDDCNKVLGFAKDRSDVLERAAVYLRRWYVA